ncbi:hypothetical protein [Enterovirga sp.]|uniref:hypothetical protein n=1 Tax=Enterovirga sp. TaxID=2026350 RepID=UPI002C026947|nr:hypothetical protein [Enterovirga sp.]HMO29449.1 hypothetical protein [Enterovirga sp.]
MDRASSGRRRAVIGVVALYAFLLQAFLGFATPAAAIPHGWLCAEAGDHGSVPHSAGHHHQCCTAAHPGHIAPPPPAAVILRPDPPRLLSVVWRPEASLPRTGPPRYAGSPRGPPAA